MYNATITVANEIVFLLLSYLSKLEQVSGSLASVALVSLGDIQRADCPAIETNASWRLLIHVTDPVTRDGCYSAEHGGTRRSTRGRSTHECGSSAFVNN